MTRRVLRIAVLVAACAALVISVGWLVSGGRWYVVRTASMGTAAPVGTLVWVRPVQADQLHVGDIVTFRAPGTSGSYSHRIIARHADGTFSTKGDAASPDPWRIGRDDILGRVELRWWGVGWLVRAAPFLLIGGAACWLLSRPLADTRRQGFLLVGISLSVAVALVVLKPLTNVERLGPGGSDATRNTFIATGLLPVRLHLPGQEVTLHSGETVTIGAVGRTEVTVDADPEWWAWVLLIAICLTPASWRTVQSAAAGRGRGRHRVPLP